MLFNSFVFILFFAVTLLCFYIVPQKLRWVLLLIGSLIFYMAWSPSLIFLLLFTVFVNFAAARKIDASHSARCRKRWLIFSLFVSFGLLFIFKYLMLFNSTMLYFFEKIGLPYRLSNFDIILPMGISFYTFQAVSYTIDVYRSSNSFKSEKNFFKFMLFISFFPQLVAGPIERAENLLPQLFSQKRFKMDNIVMGAKFMAWGFFKKIVIADRVSTAVNTVYNAPVNYQGLSFIIATVLFAFQIYCDFSGYSDIAVGCAKMMDIDLMQNFRQPYFSKSVREFWRRWHISLSTWFKDYLYFPMGGSRVSKIRYYFNTMVTFLVSGLWHGANWTFVIWGALHGGYQIIGSMTAGISRKLHVERFILVRCIQTLLTFGLVSFAWIFFRANSMGDAFYIAGHLLDGVRSWTSPQYLLDTLNKMGIQLLELCISAVCILFLMVTEMLCGERVVHDVLMRTPAFVRFVFYFVVSAMILGLGVFYNAGEFIYFQF